MATSSKGIVYTLTDPRDGSIRYVGKTIKAPLERLAQHLGAPTNPAMRVWLTSLGGQGLLPRMDTIATVAGDKLDAEEASQIKRHARDGHRLLNSPYYQANLADLWGRRPGKGVPEDTRAPSPWEVSVDALRHRLYGRIAAARAAGEITSLSAAARSLAVAPVLALGTVALLATKTKGGRRVLMLSLVGWYAWDIGFDHAARVLLLAHLPAAELLRWWHEYLARPVETLGLHVAACVVLAAWSSYIDLADAAKAKHVPAAAMLNDPRSPLLASLSAPEAKA